MGMTLGEATGGGKKMDPVPEGLHLAVCYAVIDLGRQYNPRYDKTAQKVLFQFEIPDVRCQITKDGVEKDLPRVMSKQYTFSKHEKSTLRKHLEGWRGKKFTPQELGTFDISKCVGLGCQVQVMHNDYEGRTYANIESIMPLGKGMNAPPPENPVVFYKIGEGAIPESVPDWVKDIINKSEEMVDAYAGSSGVVSEALGGGEDDSSIPF